MLKKLFAVIALTALTFSVSAQNSRISAMGGCTIFDDISLVLAFPAYLNDYTDQIQVSGTAASFGPAIGIKSFGRVMSVGATANQTTGAGSSVLRSSFVSDAGSLLNTSIIGTDIIPESFPAYPHLLVGLDFDKITLGVDVFLETSRYKATDEQGNADFTTTASLSNFGTTVNANIELGSFSVSPLFSFSIPSAKGENEQTNVKVDSEKKLRVVPGVELGLDVRDFKLIGGLFYTLESYQFELDGTDQNTNSESFVDLYVGMVTDVLNGLLFVAQYDLSLGVDKEIDSDDNEAKLTDINHNFRFGFERPISGVWIFNDLIPRAGLSYSIYDLDRMSATNDDGDTTSSTNNPNTSTQVQLTTGVGLTKGIAAVDVAMVIGSWDGVFTGPSVISATVTLDFGGRSGSSGSGRTSRPAPSPVYETDESNYQTEPETESETEESETKETETEGSDSNVDFNF